MAIIIAYGVQQTTNTTNKTTIFRASGEKCNNFASIQPQVRTNKGISHFISDSEDANNRRFQRGILKCALSLSLFSPSVRVSRYLWCKGSSLCSRYGQRSTDSKSHQCTWDRTNSLSYNLFLSIGLIGFPLGLMTVCYLLIFGHIWNTKKNLYIIDTEKPEQMVKIMKETARL
jgi:hypothetical protein